MPPIMQDDTLSMDKTTRADLKIGQRKLLARSSGSLEAMGGCGVRRSGRTLRSME